MLAILTLNGVFVAIPPPQAPAGGGVEVGVEDEDEDEDVVVVVALQSKQCCCRIVSRHPTSGTKDSWLTL